MDLLLEQMEGVVEVRWVRGHADKRTGRRQMSKHQRGNVKADANCTAIKKGVRTKQRLLLSRRKSWRLCYDGIELVGVLRKELREKMRTERLLRYFKETRGCQWWYSKPEKLDWLVTLWSRYSQHGMHTMELPW